MNPLPALPAHVREFLTEPHLGTLTTLRRDGSPHTVPVGFTTDTATGIVWVITSGGSVKAANARRDPRVSVCQVEGRRWITLQGLARVQDDPAVVAQAVHRYTARYRHPRPNPARVAIRIEVTRVLGGRWT